EMWSSGSVEPSYILRFVGIRWLRAENSMIRLVNGDSSTSLYGFLRSSSTSTSTTPFSLSFPLLPSASSLKVRRIGVINAPDFSLCCLMRVSSEETWFRIWSCKLSGWSGVIGSGQFVEVSLVIRSHGWRQFVEVIFCSGYFSVLRSVPMYDTYTQGNDTR
ncbi:hypothetical protein Tco_0310312, partial [Tanacetum coccineum]